MRGSDDLYGHPRSNVTALHVRTFLNRIMFRASHHPKTEKQLVKDKALSQGPEEKSCGSERSLNTLPSKPGVVVIQACGN